MQNLTFGDSFGTDWNNREMFRSDITVVAATKYPRILQMIYTSGERTKLENTLNPKRLPCHQILLCQCFSPIVRQKYTYGNMVESKLLWLVWLRVNCFDLCMRRYFTYMKNNNTKIDVIRIVMAQGSICCQNCQGYRFIVLDIFLVFTSAQAKK